MMRRPDEPVLSREVIVAAVRFHLVRHPSRRPTQEDIARLLDIRPRRLRRLSSALSHHWMRKEITFACLAYASRLLVHDGWDKVEAATTMAGYRNHWNANRQCRALTGCLIGVGCNQLLQLVDEQAVLRALEDIKRRDENRRRREEEQERQARLQVVRAPIRTPLQRQRVRDDRSRAGEGIARHG